MCNQPKPYTLKPLKTQAVRTQPEAYTLKTLKTQACFPQAARPGSQTHESNLNPQPSTQAIRKQFDQTLSDLGCGYLDLYLVHWPGDPTRNQGP